MRSMKRAVFAFVLAAAAVAAMWLLMRDAGVASNAERKPSAASAATELPFVRRAPPRARPAGDLEPSASDDADPVRVADRTGIAPDVPLTVRLIDSETGATVLGGRFRVNGFAGEADEARGTRRFANAGLHAGDTAELVVDVTVAPAGHVAGLRRIPVVVGAFTDAAELTVPLAPEQPLTVSVTHADGTAASRAKLQAPRVAGVERTCETPDTDDAGRSVVHGLPFVRNAVVRVVADSGDDAGHGEITLGPAPAAPSAMSIVLGPRGAWWEPPKTADPQGVSWMFRKGSGRPRGDASIVVRLQRADGTPAADALIRLGEIDPPSTSVHFVSDSAWRTVTHTDALGVAVFRGLPAGDWAILVRGAGLPLADRRVTTRGGAITEITLRPRSGVESTITVLDETGLPLPAAAVETVPAEVQDEDGLQQLVPRTDALGRCRLRGLAPGPGWVRVQWDVRDETFEFTAGADATVVLKPRRQ
jgi:hypothetical protein